MAYECGVVMMYGFGGFFNVVLTALTFSLVFFGVRYWFETKRGKKK